jgi:putative endonuclease
MDLLRKTWINCQERILAGLEWAARKRHGGDLLPAHLITGLDGEATAFFHLRRKGYTVVARRWAADDLRGDIDLIAWQGPLLCFIEVKTRTAHDITPAEVAVNDHKRKILRRLARQYVRQLPQKTAPPVRFDVLSVYLIPGQKKEFVHFEGSFRWSDWNQDRWDDRQ